MASKVPKLVERFFFFHLHLRIYPLISEREERRKRGGQGLIGDEPAMRNLLVNYLARANRKFWFCFLKILFIYFSREGKGRRKRGKETSTCGCLLHPRPPLGTWPTIQACALTGN